MADHGPKAAGRYTPFYVWRTLEGMRVFLACLPASVAGRVFDVEYLAHPRRMPAGVQAPARQASPEHSDARG